MSSQGGEDKPLKASGNSASVFKIALILRIQKSKSTEFIFKKKVSGKGGEKGGNDRSI